MKPMATGSVVIRLPLLDVEEEFVRGLGADEQTVIERTDDGEFRAVSKAGFARVVQEFRLEAAGDAETAVHAAIWVRPSPLGWLMRRGGGGGGPGGGGGRPAPGGGRPAARRAAVRAWRPAH